jgi:hypothetical protein
MQRSRLRIYGPDPGLLQRSDAMRRAARSAGADLRPFRLMLKAAELVSRESDIDQKRVQAEQAELTAGLLRNFAEAWDWVVEQRQIGPFLPYMDFWRRKTGRTVKEFEDRLQLNPTGVLGECRLWLEAWFAAMGHEAREGTAEVPAIIEEFMRLALLAGVPFFHLRHLRRAVAQQRESSLIGQALTRNLSQILDGAEPAEAIIGTLGSSRAAALGRLEEHFDVLRRALLMELMPLEAARIEIAPGDLTRLADTLAADVGFRRTTAPDDKWRQADAALAFARDFYEACLGRSAHMAAETLRVIRERGHDRAVLAVGGFHPDVVCRQFEADRRVSFSVVRPIPSLPQRHDGQLQG